MSSVATGAFDIEYKGYQLMVRQYGDRFRVFILPAWREKVALANIPHGADRAAIIEQARTIVDTALGTGG